MQNTFKIGVKMMDKLLVFRSNNNIFLTVLISSPLASTIPNFVKQTLIPFHFLHPTFISLATRFSTFEKYENLQRKVTRNQNKEERKWYLQNPIWNNKNSKQSSLCPNLN